jgi:hypothetical protein
LAIMRCSGFLVVPLGVCTVLACTSPHETPPLIPSDLHAVVVVESHQGEPLPGSVVDFQLVHTPRDTTYAPVRCQTDANGECDYRLAAYIHGWHGVTLTVTPPAGSGFQTRLVNDSAYFTTDGMPDYPGIQRFTVALRSP